MDEGADDTDETKSDEGLAPTEALIDERSKCASEDDSNGTERGTSALVGGGQDVSGDAVRDLGSRAELGVEVGCPDNSSPPCAEIARGQQREGGRAGRMEAPSRGAKQPGEDEGSKQRAHSCCRSQRRMPVKQQGRFSDHQRSRGSRTSDLLQGKRIERRP